MNNRFKKVKSLVANGEIRLAAYELFSLLGTFTPSDKEAYDDVVMLISTYLENEHQNILGVSNDQSHMERAKKGILTVLRNLEATWNDSEERVEDIDNSINTHVEKGDFKMASKKFKELLSKAENLFVEFENLISHIDSSNASSFTSILDKLEEEISKYLSITALPFMNYSIKRDKDKLNTIINRKFKNSYEGIEFLKDGHSGWYFKGKEKGTEENVVIVFLKINSLDDFPETKEIGIIRNLKGNIIKLRHDNKLPPYFVLKYIDGITLKEALRLFGGFPVIEAIDIMLKIVEALDEIRQKKILHSNIRPSKIIIDYDGTPNISSLDIMKYTKDDLRSLTRFKQECQYLSPEVLDMKLVEENLSLQKSEKSDQFSLGVLLLEMITGQSLFEADTTSGIFEKRINFFESKTPKKYLGEALKHQKYGKSLIGLLQTMLEKDPAERYKNLARVKDELLKIRSKVLDQSPLWSSFYKCYQNDNEMIQKFYQRFFLKVKNIKNDFHSLNRQYMMIRYAIFVIFEIETKEEFLKSILKLSHHAKYSDIKDIKLYETFLYTLRDTVKDLLDDEWDEATMLEPWNEKIQKTLEVIRTHLKTPK